MLLFILGIDVEVTEKIIDLDYSDSVPATVAFF